MIETLHDFIRRFGSIWTYPGRDANQQKIFDECERLEGLGELRRESPKDFPDVVIFFVNAPKVVK